MSKPDALAVRPARVANARPPGHARVNRAALVVLARILRRGCAGPVAGNDGPVAGNDAGESTYREGVLSTGKPLRGERPSAPAVQGAAAACTNCHRRSGLGELEGRALVPPITAKYLYRPRSQNRPNVLENRALTMTEPGARVELLRQADRGGAYTDATLARAIREGLGPDGRALDFLMPRFRIN
ncbi:MAG: hypothetical protein E6H52_19760, partial [Betaproteobacteria bacterium]